MLIKMCKKNYFLLQLIIYYISFLSGLIIFMEILLLSNKINFIILNCCIRLQHSYNNIIFLIKKK